MDNLDRLIPNQILNLMKLKRFDFELSLSATPCNDRWPMVKVTIDKEVVFDGTIVNHQWVSYRNEFDNISNLEVLIEYYNKQDYDTTVDSAGQIVENQSVTITELTINEIRLVKTQIIYKLGMFYQNLSTAKQQYFVDHGIDTGPSHTLCLYENGMWVLKFQLPVMQQFVKFKSSQAPSEQWPNPGLLSEIHTLIQDIRRLTE